MTGYFVPASILFLSVGLLLYSLFDRQGMIYLLTHFSYYIVLTLIFIWLNQVCVFFDKRGWPSLKKYLPGIFIAFILTGSIFFSVKPGIRTLNDETNLLSVSRSMLVDRTIYNTAMAEYYQGRLFGIDDTIPKRPFLFPFLVSLIHSVIGFNPSSPFILNFLVMFFFLCMIYIFFRQYLETSSAMAAIFLVASYPVFSIFGTSGGFDLLALALFFLSFFILFVFLKKPTAESLALLWMTLILQTHARYESFIYLFIVMGFLLFFRHIKWKDVKKYSFVYALTIFFILPLVWQRIVTPAQSYQAPKGQMLFSLDAFVQNFFVFIVRLPNEDFSLPYNGVVNVLAVALVFYFGFRIAKKEIILEKPLRHFILIFMSCFFVYITMVFSLTAEGSPKYTNAVVTRLMLILCVFLAIMPVVWKIYSPKIFSGRKMLLLSVGLFILFHPIAVSGQHVHRLKSIRLLREGRAFLNGVRDKSILIISNRAPCSTALNYGAIRVYYANKNSKDILEEFRKHYYTRIFHFQTVAYPDRKPLKEEELSEAYNCRVLKEVRIGKKYFLRISEVLPPPISEEGKEN